MAKIRAMVGTGGSQPTETVLWTNPSPTADFASGTASLSQSMTNFDMLKIEYKCAKGDASSSAVSDWFPVEDFINCGGHSTNSKPKFAIGARSSDKLYARIVSYNSNTEVAFGAAQQINAQSTANGTTIPIKIIGVKY